MIKNIKRVGIIFLAVAIICLMVISCCLALNGKFVENISASLDSGKDIQTTVDFVLQSGNHASKWNDAVTQSANNDGKNVNVVLNSDWIAPTTGNHNFGIGDGFFDGAIYIPQYTTITLDLNGKLINRGLTSVIYGGSVIRVDGTLILKDSKYSSTAVRDAFYNDYTTDLTTKSTGGITGGYSVGGGGILVRGGNLIMNGGKIFDNKASSGGGGILFDSPDTISDEIKVIINDGLIANNIALGNSGDGSAIMVGSKNCKVFMNGGIVHNNSVEDAGAVRISTGYMEMTGGIIAYNNNGGVWLDEATVEINGGIITKNKIGVKVAKSLDVCKFYVGAGTQIYENYNAFESNADECNVYLVKDNYIRVKDKLMENGKATHVGITKDNVSDGKILVNTKDYGGSAGEQQKVNYSFYYDIDSNGFDSYFLSDDEDGNVIFSKVSNEAEITFLDLSWSVYSKSNNNIYGISQEGYAIVPYRTDGYIVEYNGETGGITIGHVFDLIKEPGTYAFICEEVNKPSNYYQRCIMKNCTFMLIIEGEQIAKPTGGNTNTFTYDGNAKQFVPSGYNENEMYIYNNSATTAGTYYAFITPKSPFKWIGGSTELVSYEYVIKPKKVEIPKVAEDKIVYNGNEQTFSFTFDTDLMELTSNKGTNVGEYTAKLSLKDSINYAWTDGSNKPIDIKFRIIHPGLVVKAESSYDYIYLDKDGIRQTYKQNDLIHKLNDDSIYNNCNKYVLGGIKAGTTLSELLTNFNNDSELIVVKDCNGKIIENKELVATGYELILYTDNSKQSVYDTIYLSVLGDLTGDGVINSADVNCIRRIISNEIEFNNIPLEFQLAGLVENKGKITAIDSEVLWNVVTKDFDILNYFTKSESNLTNEYVIWEIEMTENSIFRTSTELNVTAIQNGTVIGGVQVGTTVEDFIDTLVLQGFNRDNITIAKPNFNNASETDIIGTGWFVLYEDKKLSVAVLGDLTGDGMVNSVDYLLLNRILNNDLDEFSEIILMAMLVQNNGGITTADSATIWEHIVCKIDINSYI